MQFPEFWYAFYITWFPNFECPIKIKSRNSFFKIAAGRKIAVLLVGLRDLRFFQKWKASADTEREFMVVY